MNSKAFHIIILSLCVAAIAASYAFTLNDIGAYFFGFKWSIHCFFNHTFGTKCEYCRMICSVTSMAHGQFARAFNFHPLGPILFALIAFQIPYRIWALIKIPKKIHPTLRKLNKYAIALTIIAIIINWLYHLTADLMK
ncbi:MAG: DUF2752 domain-containing protein [Planctomycetes bacterium]|nr:DUF2752 domain-containing protein [Planctomycetota bacterium]